MEASARKYRTDIIAGLEKNNGRNYHAHYAMYLAEFLLNGFGRNKEELKQDFLFFRPTTSLRGGHDSGIESLGVQFKYQLTNEVYSELGDRLLPELITPLKELVIQKDENINEGLYDEDEFSRKVLRLLPELSENILGIIQDASSIPNFSFVFPDGALYGPQAKFPQCYHFDVFLKQLGEREEGKVPLQNFLDMFNSRFFWLRFQAWKKLRLHLQLDGQPGNEAFRTLFSFAGLPAFLNTDDKVKPSQEVQTLSKHVNQLRLRMLGLTGLFGTFVRNSSGLIRVLTHFFPSLSFQVEQFVPQRRMLDERPVLGGSETESRMCLGSNAIIGDSVVDYTSMIRLVIGPMRFGEYKQFYPGCSKLEVLESLVDLYLPDDMEYCYAFFIHKTHKKGDIHPMKLSDLSKKNGENTAHCAEYSNLLGYSCWIGMPEEDIVRVERERIQTTSSEKH